MGAHPASAVARVDRRAAIAAGRSARSARARAGGARRAVAPRQHARRRRCASRSRDATRMPRPWRRPGARHATACCTSKWTCTCCFRWRNWSRGGARRTTPRGSQPHFARALEIVRATRIAADLVGAPALGRHPAGDPAEPARRPQAARARAVSRHRPTARSRPSWRRRGACGRPRSPGRWMPMRSRRPRTVCRRPAWGGTAPAWPVTARAAATDRKVVGASAVLRARAAPGERHPRKAARTDEEERRRRPPPPEGVALSERELDVARLVLQGKTYAEIGETIFISPRTAEHHIAHIRRRLGATSRSDLIAKLRVVVEQSGPRRGSRSPPTRGWARDPRSGPPMASGEPPMPPRGTTE